MRRASKSIPANIAEGYGRIEAIREFRAYVNNALGSADEMIVHLKTARALGYAEGSQCDELIMAYTVVAKQLHRLMPSWQNFESRSKR